MAGRTIHEMFATYTDAVQGINAIKSQLMGGRLFHEPRPQLLTYLSNDVNRYWEIIEDIENHLRRYKFNNTSQHRDFSKALEWYYEGGKEGFELKAKDIYNEITIYVPGTPEEISRIKNDARMSFVVLTKRSRLIEGMRLYHEIQNERQTYDPNPKDGVKSQLELYEEMMRARDAKELSTLYYTLVHGLSSLINFVTSVKHPYKSEWNLEALDIRGKLEDLHGILSAKSTDLRKLCETEAEGSEKSEDFKQMISKTLIMMLIHVDYFLIEISDPAMYKDTITNYTRERKSWNYVFAMENFYAEESKSYYTAWEPQFSRRINVLAKGIRAVTAEPILSNGKSLLGIS